MSEITLFLNDDIADMLAARAGRLGISLSEHAQILLADCLSGASTADRVADLVKAVDSLSTKVGGLAGVAADLSSATTASSTSSAAPWSAAAESTPVGAAPPAGPHRDILTGKIIRFQADPTTEPVPVPPAKPGAIRTASGRVLSFHH